MVHKKITIQRYAIPDLKRERKVYVNLPDGKSYGIDPQLEIMYATGAWISRQACVLSMADGMILAGTNVHFGIYTPDRHRYKYTRIKHLLRPNPVPVYAFLGFALANDLWHTCYKLWIQSVPHEKRFAVLEYNAIRLFTEPTSAFAFQLTAPLHLLVP